MGVFGPQLVMTMIMSSFLSKVVPYYSPADWLLCKTGLSYFLHPSDEQLKGTTSKRKERNAGKEKNGGKDKNGAKDKNGVPDDGTFFVQQKNIDLNLKKSPVTKLEAVQLRFFPDYQWLMDFTVCALIVYTATEMYSYFYPTREEMNLSMVWCLLAIGFFVKTLLSVTLVYFRARAGEGEKWLVVLALFCYLLLAMMLLIVSEDKLELGLDEAYSAFNHSATHFIRSQEINNVGVFSKMACKAIFAIFSAVFGACLAFPGLRFGKMHYDAIKIHDQRRFLQFLLHSAFIAPAFVTLLWVRPVARTYIVETTWPGYSKPLLTDESFCVLRILAVVFACLLRLSVLPVYLQSYLDMAQLKLEEQRKHAGKITNRQIQQQVAGVYYYLVVVTLQYLLPLLMSLVLAVMLKTLGDYHWSVLSDPRNADSFLSSNSSTASTIKNGGMTLVEMSETTQAISLGFEQFRKLFVPTIWRGVLGFWLWWSVFTWFLSGCIGFVYQRQLTQI